MWPDRLGLHRLAETTPDGCLVREQACLNDANSNAKATALLLWELPTYAVIVGRSNVLETEVDLTACATDGVPILRRSSGGGAVVLGPGCLCYALVLPIGEPHRQRGVPAVTSDIMQRLATALSDEDRPIEVHGVSDLVIADRKFSGNSQRWLRNALLHHGTVLYDFDLNRISRYLHSPSRQPNYREQRPHATFVANLALPRAEIEQRLIVTWNASLG